MIRQFHTVGQPCDDVHEPASTDCGPVPIEQPSEVGHDVAVLAQKIREPALQFAGRAGRCQVQQRPGLRRTRQSVLLGHLIDAE
ncbi:MAG: hypothetical protein KG028_03150 [Actinobacteria bacterium]|nr:hypothetical protein [Actinomycetota bacterium]